MHEATHWNVFEEPSANAWFGRVALWLAGTPYADYGHVRRMHMAHHKDRADTVEFDYREFVKSNGAIRRVVLLLEYCFVPMVETIMHIRTALFPILQPTKVTVARHRSALIGSFAQLLFYSFLWMHSILLPHILSGVLVLQYLALNDAFHHTYEAILMQDYVPGPGRRTAQYEEENTYSNLVSVQHPWLNTLLSLNFGYHNAHHEKPMTPWYNLPALHDQLYTSPKNDATIYPQLLPLTDVLSAWFTHRLRRVTEEDYGVVHKVGTPGRADDFVGALGVSFLTV